MTEYCRDYIDLISPSLISRGGKKVRLTAEVFNAEPLMKSIAEINYDDQIILPVNLTINLSELSVEIEEADSELNKIIEKRLGDSS